MRPIKFLFVVDTHFSPVCKDPHVTAKARAAGRCRHGTSGIDEGLDEAGMYGPGVIVGVAGMTMQRTCGWTLCPLEDAGCDSQILETAVRAGTDDHRIDLDLPEGADDLRIFRAGRCGKETTGFIEERSTLRRGNSARLHLPRRQRTAYGSAPQCRRWSFHRLGKCHSSRRLRSCHIRNGETVGQRKGMNARAGEFQRLVQRTIDADHADQCQDDILTGDVLRLRAGQDDFDRIRHFEPCFAGRHGNAEVGRTDAVEKPPSAP